MKGYCLIITLTNVRKKGGWLQRGKGWKWREYQRHRHNMRVFELYTHLITSLGTVLQCVWRIEENYMFLLHVIWNAGHTKCTINLEGLISNTARIILRYSQGLLLQSATSFRTNFNYIQWFSPYRAVNTHFFSVIKTSQLTLYVLMCRTEVWTLSKNHENTLATWEKKILRKIFGTVKEKRQRQRHRKQQQIFGSGSFKVCNITVMKSRRIGWAGHVACGVRKEH
jgi:hypothetical protein